MDPADRIDGLHIGVQHECTWELSPDVFEDPGGFVEATLFAGLLAPDGPAEDSLQSLLYLDDGGGSLAHAGHSLSVVSATSSATCLLAFEQTVHRRRWRDGLAIHQWIPYLEMNARLETDPALPVAHARALGLLTGEVQPAGVGVQRRYHQPCRTPDGTEIRCHVDRVDFGTPTGGRTGNGRYACVEIEVTCSAPAALEDLARIGAALDARLGVPRDETSKAQRAWEAR